MQEVDDLISLGMRIDRETGNIEFPDNIIIAPNLTLDEFLRKYSKIINKKSTMGMPWIKCRIAQNRYGMFLYFHGQELGLIDFGVKQSIKKQDEDNYSKTEEKKLNDHLLYRLLGEPDRRWEDGDIFYDLGQVKINSITDDDHGGGPSILIRYKAYKKQ
ncbi:MAG: hypothetical protein AB7U41_00440 [Dongiaceae bacterium]